MISPPSHVEVLNYDAKYSNHIPCRSHTITCIHIFDTYCSTWINLPNKHGPSTVVFFLGENGSFWRFGDSEVFSQCSGLDLITHFLSKSFVFYHQSLKCRSIFATGVTTPGHGIHTREVSITRHRYACRAVLSIFYTDWPEQPFFLHNSADRNE